MTQPDLKQCVPVIVAAAFLLFTACADSPTAAPTLASMTRAASTASEIASDDVDADGVTDDIDNCKFDYNPDQADNDADGFGNPCDVAPYDPENDADSDGVTGDADNCRYVPNADQADADFDGMGDTCDPFPSDPMNDADGDKIPGSTDNCPVTVNPDQKDSDRDGIGDACDAASVPQQLETLAITVRALAENGTLNRGQSNSLEVKLAAVATSYERGDKEAARNQLGAFANEVAALARSGRINEKIANYFQTRSYEIMLGLGT